MVRRVSMNTKQIDNTRDILLSINECIKDIKISQEKLTFEIERNSRRYDSLSEVNCFTKEDKIFFNEQNQRMREIKISSEKDFDENTKALQRQKIRLEEEIEEAEREAKHQEEENRFEDNKNEDDSEEESGDKTDDIINDDNGWRY